MPNASVIAALNDLLAIEYRSLPMYLVSARPWTHPGDERAAQTLRDIETDQQANVQRLIDAILVRGGTFDLGEFPMEFTGMHDLSLDFLISQLVQYQRRDVEWIAGIVERLSADHQAHELGQEVLGSERAHLEALEGMQVMN